MRGAVSEVAEGRLCLLALLNLSPSAGTLISVLLVASNESFGELFNIVVVEVSWTRQKFFLPFIICHKRVSIIMDRVRLRLHDVCCQRESDVLFIGRLGQGRSHAVVLLGDPWMDLVCCQTCLLLAESSLRESKTDLG